MYRKQIMTHIRKAGSAQACEIKLSPNNLNKEVTQRKCSQLSTMVSGNGGLSVERKRAIVSALCKSRSLDALTQIISAYSSAYFLLSPSLAISTTVMVIELMQTTIITKLLLSYVETTFRRCYSSGGFGRVMGRLAAPWRCDHDNDIETGRRLCRMLPPVFNDRFITTKFLDDEGSDIKSLSVNIMKTAYENNEEFNKWVAFAENFPSDSAACLKGLSQLNEFLTNYSVLVGGGYRPSDADIIVFSTVHPYVVSLPNTDKNKLPHLMRWMDYIQSTHDFGELFEKIVLEKAPFDPPLAKQTAKVEAESSTKKAESSTKKAESSTKKAAPDAKAANSGAESEKKSDSV
ncbi:hypothetical protein M8C21_023635 [Ambrosia artemisiifolia]|uniref:GST C-terminal domain-containing protein n=1 Tax=Ambrosia artemisiifolia TaxID=4212 RepID=A0AAD5CZJ2_AMBAR|nr:hypothetical protein M8C21_023635 [Ambrosia artemisiifolia]